MKKNTKKISKKQSSNKKSFWKRILIGIFLFPVIMAVLLFIALYIDYVNFKLDHEKCVAEDEELYRREEYTDRLFSRIS